MGRLIGKIQRSIKTKKFPKLDSKIIKYFFAPGILQAINFKIVDLIIIVCASKIKIINFPLYMRFGLAMAGMLLYVEIRKKKEFSL